jgi:hypothetical protein
LSHEELSRRKGGGFNKIVNNCAQAVQDGHRYIWIDTCCIDKKSSAELSEAINSMFRYYQGARVCYAFLADVRERDCMPLGIDYGAWNEEFSSSRWFTRGWTLQELIAPRYVNFFSLNWKPVSDF